MTDESREERLARLRADRRPGPKLTPAKPTPRPVEASTTDGGDCR